MGSAPTNHRGLVEDDDRRTTYADVLCEAMTRASIDRRPCTVTFDHLATRDRLRLTVELVHDGASHA